MYTNPDPKQRYLIANQVKLDADQEEVLVKLYQPLLGAEASSLYHSLIQNYDPYVSWSDAAAVYLLQEQLDVSLAKFYQALHKLEATGLVESYLFTKLDQQFLVFKLHPVPTSAAFFSTPLLASLLREKIGDLRFQKLSRSFARKNKLANKDLGQGQNISASFFEVFSLPAAEAITPSKAVQEAARDNHQPELDQARVNQGNKIDWDLLISEFETYQIPAGEIKKNQAAIAGLMQTYGLSEQEFVDEVLPCLHGSYQLNLKQIAHYLADNIKLEQSRQQVESSLQLAPETKKIIKGLGQKDQELIKRAYSLSPVEFLYQEKNQKGGFVSGKEKALANLLHVRYGLPNDLINVLIHTCLEYDSVFSANLANTIANDWLQNSITTAAKAVAYLKKRQQPGGRKSKYYRRQTRTVEKGTDWSKKQAKTNLKLSDEKLNQMLDSFGKDKG
jgi:replication initiation and membrane attachment protein